MQNNHLSLSAESYGSIARYALPEIISACVLMSNIIDARFIAQLNSTILYATLGVTSVLIQLLYKAAEGIGVGAVILCGKYNGKKDYAMTGTVICHAYILAAGIGLLVASVLYGGAHIIYSYAGMSAEIVRTGTPYLQLRALSIALMFMVLSLVGCLRGIKNTTIPMVFFTLGSLAFAVADYGLIFGHWGLPALGFTGSAWAYIVQYALMLIGILCYFFIMPSMSKYQLYRIPHLDHTLLRELCLLSWPVIIDKSALAAAKVWIVIMLAPLGNQVLGSFSAIKDLEQIAFIPAIACAQVITFLVSNARAAQQWSTIELTVKRVLGLSVLMVSSILVIFCTYSDFFIGLFDKQHTFGHIAKVALPILSILVVCDVFQIIFAGALRGASDVMTVMWTRITILSIFVVPASGLLYYWQTDYTVLKFILIYSCFYVGNGLMSLVYWFRFAYFHRQGIPQ